MNKGAIINVLGKLKFLKEKNKKSDHPLIVSNYHVISDEKSPHIKHIYKYKDTTEFENDLKFFTKYFSKVSLEDIIQNLDNKKILNNSFFLTFDDGCVETLTVIAPILKKYDVKAAFFLNPAFVDNKEMFYRHKASILIEKISTGSINQNQRNKINNLLDNYNIKNGPINSRLLNIKYQDKVLLDEIANILSFSYSEFLIKQKPYLNSNQVRQLISQGHYIGGHSIDHPLFSDLGLSEQIRQTVESINYVTDTFNLKYRIFSIPHLDNNISKKYFEEMLYKENIDVIFGNSNLRIEKYYEQVIHRITGENPDYAIYDFINSHILYDKFERLLGKNKIIRN